MLLADALETEFDPAFWDTVNYGRKERWGFLELPWDGKVYGAAPQYAQVRLSIFNRDAHTMRVVQPFVWNHTHLKVHPNGAVLVQDQGVIPGSPTSPTFTIVGAVTNRWVQPMVTLLFFLFWYPPAMFSFWKPPFPISFLPPGVHSLPFAAFAVQSRAMDCCLIDHVSGIANLHR